MAGLVPAIHAFLFVVLFIVEEILSHYLDIETVIYNYLEIWKQSRWHAVASCGGWGREMRTKRLQRIESVNAAALKGRARVEFVATAHSSAKVDASRLISTLSQG